jgi:hypothetical protein
LKVPTIRQRAGGVDVVEVLYELGDALGSEVVGKVAHNGEKVEKDLCALEFFGRNRL